MKFFLRIQSIQRRKSQEWFIHQICLLGKKQLDLAKQKANWLIKLITKWWWWSLVWIFWLVIHTHTKHKSNSHRANTEEHTVKNDGWIIIKVFGFSVYKILIFFFPSKNIFIIFQLNNNFWLLKEKTNHHHHWKYQITITPLV